LGRLLRITSFSSSTAHDEYIKMDNKLRRSMGKDRKQLRDSGAVERLIKGQAESQMESVYTTEMLRAIDTIRIRFAGSIVRRTLQSVDHAGRRISGLEPYHRHAISISLYPHEMDNLEVVAKDLVKDGKSKAAQLTGGSVSLTQFFYPSFSFFLMDWSPRTFTSKCDVPSFTQAVTLAIHGRTRRR